VANAIARSAVTYLLLHGITLPVRSSISEPRDKTRLRCGACGVLTISIKPPVMIARSGSVKEAT
jgi:hypothetical protein